VCTIQITEERPSRTTTEQELTPVKSQLLSGTCLSVTILLSNPPKRMRTLLVTGQINQKKNQQLAFALLILQQDHKSGHPLHSGHWSAGRVFCDPDLIGHGAYTGGTMQLYMRQSETPEGSDDDGDISMPVRKLCCR
jgi:hypothetical protein